MVCDKLAVIVPVYNCPELLEECHTGLLTTNYPIEIIYVDNNSSDIRTLNLLDDFQRHGAKVVHNLSNLGFSCAVNIGARQTDAEFLALYNQDCVTPRENWAKKVVEMFRSNENCAVQGAKLIYPGTNKIQHAGIVFPKGTSGRHIYDGLDADHPNVCVSRQYEAVTGAVMAIRNSVFTALSGFDEGYVLNCEDTDFCFRVKRDFGMEIWYNCEVVVYHYDHGVKKNTSGVEEKIRLSTNRFYDMWGDHIRSIG